MERKLVRFLFKIGCSKLAHRISPSLYYQCVGERFARQCTEAMNSMAAFMVAASAALPRKEEANNEND